MAEYGNCVIINHPCNPISQEEIESYVLADWAQAMLAHPEYGLKNPEIVPGPVMHYGQAWGWYEEVTDE